MALKENSLKVYEYVKANMGSDFTAKDIAAALDLTASQVNGIITSAFQRKGLMFREEAEITLDDGSHDKVKFIRMSPEGAAFDPYATDAE